MNSVSVRDPVSGESVTFIGLGDDTKKIVRLHLELSDRHWLTIKEVYHMTRVALFGPAALDDDFDADAEIKEIKKRQCEAERDAAVLACPLPIEEAMAIWERARDGLRWLVGHCPNPEKRARLAAFLAQREAAMERLSGKMLAHRRAEECR
jgi:hypothetical protein